MSELVAVARAAAEELMRDLPRRWAHVQSVADKSEQLRPAFGDQADLLVASAWLHDVGYSKKLVQTEFHPVDGALYLRARGACNGLCCLVANHSAAATEAVLRDLSEYMVQFPDDQSAVRDALWACDMTTDPVGTSISFDGRLSEIRSRYGQDHTVPRAIGSAAAEIRGCIERTKKLADAAGIEVDLRV